MFFYLINLWDVDLVAKVGLLLNLLGINLMLIPKLCVTRLLIKIRANAGCVVFAS